MGPINETAPCYRPHCSGGDSIHFRRENNDININPRIAHSVLIHYLILIDTHFYENTEISQLLVNKNCPCQLYIILFTILFTIGAKMELKRVPLQTIE